MQLIHLIEIECSILLKLKQSHVRHLDLSDDAYNALNVFSGLFYIDLMNQLRHKSFFFVFCPANCF